MSTSMQNWRTISRRFLSQSISPCEFVTLGSTLGAPERARLVNSIREFVLEGTSLTQPQAAALELFAGSLPGGDPDTWRKLAVQFYNDFPHTADEFVIRARGLCKPERKMLLNKLDRMRNGRRFSEKQEWIFASLDDLDCDFVRHYYLDTNGSD